MKRIVLTMVLWAGIVLVSSAQNPAAMSIRSKFDGLSSGPAPAPNAPAATPSPPAAPPVDEWQQAKKLTRLEKMPPAPRRPEDCLPPTGLTENAVGYLECWPMAVATIVGPNEVLLVMNTPNAPPILLTDQATKGLVQGDKVRLVGPIEVVALKPLPGVPGNKAACVVRLMTQERFAEVQAKATAGALAAAVRKWSDAGGKFSVMASFVDYQNGQVSLKRETDGKTIEVPLAKLSQQDQKWVREEVARRKDAKRAEQSQPTAK